VWLVYLLVGIVAAGGCFLLPLVGAQNILYDLIGFSAAVATLVGVYVNCPVHPLPWYVFAFALLILVTGEVIWTYYESFLGVETPCPSIADAGSGSKAKDKLEE
jgi:hypothetical protein